MPSYSLWITILSAIVLVAAIWSIPREHAEAPRNIRGRNNTALFIVNEHPGFSNVHLATAQSLLEHYPDIELHFTSFDKLASKCQMLSDAAKLRHPSTKGITFHPINGPSYSNSTRSGKNGEVLGPDSDGRLGGLLAPGVQGINQLGAHMQIYLDPWSAEEHFSYYAQALRVIDGVNPAIVVLDTLFMPGVEATRERDRAHAIIIPNLASDTFGPAQPWLGMLWKYPALGSGIPFPVPYSQLLTNVYLNIRFIYSTIQMPAVRSKRKFLSLHGVKDPINLASLYRPDVPWLTQTLPAAGIPLDVLPVNVTCTGPILLHSATAEEQDAELMSWVKQSPTILINLGSMFTYSITQTHQMVSAILDVLEKTELQVLWKYTVSPNIQDTFDWNAALAAARLTNRVRVVPWVSIDPAALLASGHIVASLTHGGAGGYHEAVASGAPQIVLPLWADLYNYAQLAESKGLGVWACRDVNPEWTVACLSEAIISVAAGPRSGEFRKAAQMLGEKSREHGVGRDNAAHIIAGLARSGTA